MGSKITIIGAGSVGSTIAHILSLKPYVSELVMIDILKDKADGEIMDMAQGTGFRDPISMIAGDYEDAAGSDIVIVTSGVARRPGQTRIELAKTNVAIMKNIAPQVAKHAPNALCIIVANPVDVLTYAFLKYSGMKENQVIGSGTLLDTVRLTYKLSQELEKRSNKVYKMNFLYPVLYRLQEQGYVVEYSQEITESHRTRNYYAITDEGKQYLKKMIEQYKGLLSAVDVIMNNETNKEALENENV